MLRNHKFRVIDLETSIKAPKGFKANPFYPSNEIVMLGEGGYVPDGKAPLKITVVDTLTIPSDVDHRLSDNTLVGHNIKFDLHYLMRTHRHLMVGNFSIWDTQLAEYIITGQQTQTASLDELSTKYGGTLKDDKIKAYWDAGVDTEDIPKEELEEYLRADLTNTHIIAEAQMQWCSDKGMLLFVMAQMDALWATTVMEYNGLLLSPKALNKAMRDTEKLKHQADTHFFKGVSTFDKKWVPPTGYNFKITSAYDISKLLFGGTYTMTTNLLVGKYKNGKDKYKLTDTTYLRGGILPKTLQDRYRKDTKRTGIFVTDDDTLNKILSDLAKGTYTYLVVSSLIDSRFYTKELSTYYSNLDELKGDDNVIHHHLNHTVTRTSRLSSSSPNLQNQTTKAKSLVKTVFVPRKGNVLVELDYKQLEMIALAYLCRDPQLIKDINNGFDTHQWTAEEAYDRTTISDEERRNAKAVNFGTVYGGGAPTLSRSSGVPLEIVKGIRQALLSRYPRIEVYWSRAISEVLDSPSTVHYSKEIGGTCKHYHYLSVTGREYVFPEELYYGKLGPSPAKIKNYPVQGLATGDLVPIMLGHLNRYLIESENEAMLLNTVHDSVVVEIPEHRLEQDAAGIVKIMEKAGSYINPFLDRPFDLPLTIDVKYGINLKEMKKLDLSAYL